MPAALAGSVRIPTNPQHGRKGDKKGNSGNHRDFKRIETRKLLNDFGQPDAEAILRRGAEEVGQGEKDHVALKKGAPRVQIRTLLLIQSLALQLAGDPGAFVVAKPARFFCPVSKIE